jgi:multiple sugar transport system permease protein
MAGKVGLSQKKAQMGWLYIAPWIVGFVGLGLFPYAYSFYISLNKWDLLTEPKFRGFKNYVNLFNDPLFIVSIKNTIMYMIFSMLVGLILALIVAAFLSGRLKGGYIYRTLFYLPNLIVPVAFGLMMQPIFRAQEYGLLNIFLGLFGMKPVYWLEDPNIAIWSVIVTGYWYIGGAMVVFLAGIKGISPSYYEAAAIDGAGWFRKFLHITVPLLMPMIVFQLVCGLIGSLQIFDIPAALANVGQGGGLYQMGVRNSLATLLFYLYFKGFRFWEMGAAAAIGWVVFAIGFVLSLIIMRVIKNASYTVDRVE